MLKLMTKTSKTLRAGLSVWRATSTTTKTTTGTKTTTSASLDGRLPGNANKTHREWPRPPPPPPQSLHNRVINDRGRFNQDDNNNYNNNSSHQGRALRLNLALVMSYLLYDYYGKHNRKLLAESRPAEHGERGATVAGLPLDGLPTYSLKEVAGHDSHANGVWIIYKAGVYDVTNFLRFHPGGDNILLGAGNSVEPFWEVYGQHKSPEVYELLETFRIGNLREEDRLKASDVKLDTVEYIPEGRNFDLTIHHVKPYNSETPPEMLTESFLTPSDKFFVRHHLAVPEVNPVDYQLEIEGLGIEGVCTLSLDEIKTLFPKHSVTSVVQCAGNRRKDFNAHKPVKGIAWGVGAMGNATWSGARLVDVLRHCRADTSHPDIRHVQFEGYDRDATGSPYGASVPADRALDPLAEFVLAYEMNGETLTPDHGYPIRLIAPGVAGARNVKWLERIVLSGEESTCFWQRNDYKSFPSNQDSATAEDWSNAHAIQEMPIQSAVCTPKPNESVAIQWKPNEAGQTTPVLPIAGYAWSGGGRDIIRVDISIDGGRTWTKATLEQETPKKGPNHTYSWTLWSLDLPLATGELFQGNQIEIICRAFDSAYNTQPATSQEIWNLRGLLNNSWHRVPITIA